MSHVKIVAAVVVLVAALPGQAYIDKPAENLTLPRLVLEFRRIGVFTVDRLDLDKGAVRFVCRDCLQGQPETEAVRHAIKGEGDVPPELKGLKAGATAVLFSGDGYQRGIACVDGAWYCCNIDRATGWWRIAYTASHYDFNCAFTGSPAELTAAIQKLLRGEDAVVRCRTKSRGQETQWVSCSLRTPHRKVAAAAPPADGGPTPPRAEPRRNVATLQAALADKDFRVRVAAADELGWLGGMAQPAVPALARILEGDADVFVRRMAAVALGAIGPEAKAAVPALVALLQSHYENANGLVGAESAVALARIDPDGTATSAVLVPRLKAASPDTRMQAAGALAVVGRIARNDVPTLIAALKDPAEGVRYEVVRAVGVIRPDAPLAVPALTAALRDPDKHVRFAAARVLGLYGAAAKEAIPALQTATKDPDGEVRQHATEALRLIALE